jgi:5-methylcytosine-specific restriction endonuclease McrA
MSTKCKTQEERDARRAASVRKYLDKLKAATVEKKASRPPKMTPDEKRARKNKQSRECKARRKAKDPALWAKEQRDRGKQWAEKNPERDKELRAKASKKYRATHPEKVAESRKISYAKWLAKQDPEEVKRKHNAANLKYRRRLGAKPKRHPTPEQKKLEMAEYGRKAYQANPGKYHAASKKWIAEHPKEARAMQRKAQHKRRAKLAGTNSPGVTPAEWANIVDYFSQACAYCLQRATSIEHLHPIAIGGEDAPDNVVPACLRCNKSKGPKMTLRWLLTSKIAQEALL